MVNTINEMMKSFGIGGKFKDYKVFNSGHINTTCLVVMDEDGEEKKYVLQKINTNVFEIPEDVMGNIVNVTGFIRDKYEEAGYDASRSVLNFHQSVYGYYFVIDAIDEAGNTASKGDVYFYLQPEPIDIQFTSDKSEINYGDDVTLNYSASGGAGAFKYNLYAYDENGSRYTLVENTSEKTFKWTSNLEGKVRFEINAVDSKISIETKSLDINVLKLNKTFIYYKGYDNPNIHYKVGNGAWTVVPGVKMVRTSDVEGYPYMAEIDLGDSKTLTACFNNGNGVWDNNGGKDYTFEAGYYTICNGVINKINKPNSGIKINELTSKLGNTYAQGNENIFETKILNAVGDVQYKYSYINNVTGDACIIRDFSKYNNLAWKYYKPGNYTITVEVKDSNGNTATKSIEINITE